MPIVARLFTRGRALARTPRATICTPWPGAACARLTAHLRAGVAQDATVNPRMRPDTLHPLPDVPQAPSSQLRTGGCHALSSEGGTENAALPAGEIGRHAAVMRQIMFTADSDPGPADWPRLPFRGDVIRQPQRRMADVGDRTAAAHLDDIEARTAALRQPRASPAPPRQQLVRRLTAAMPTCAGVRAGRHPPARLWLVRRACLRMPAAWVTGTDRKGPGYQA